MYDPLDEWTSVDDRIILAVGLPRLGRFRPAAASGPSQQQRGCRDRQSPRDADGTAPVRCGPAQPGRPRRAGRRWIGPRLVALARASVMGAAADSVSGVRLGDLYAFANAAASITNGAASIVDPLGRVLGYSTLPGQPIDELRARHHPLPAGDHSRRRSMRISRSSMRRAGAVLIPGVDEEMARLALAVRAGGELLGSIWIIDPGEDKREAALERTRQNGAPGRTAHAACPLGIRLRGTPERRLDPDAHGRPRPCLLCRGPARSRCANGLAVAGIFDCPARNREPGVGAGDPSVAAPGHDRLQHPVQRQPQRPHRLDRLRPAALRRKRPQGCASAGRPGNRRLRSHHQLLPAHRCRRRHRISGRGPARVPGGALQTLQYLRHRHRRARSVRAAGASSRTTGFR